MMFATVMSSLMAVRAPKAAFVVRCRVMSSKKTGPGSAKYVYQYVHPLSQIVLECLNDLNSESLIRSRLHHNSDGTFDLRCRPDCPSGEGTRIWTSFDQQEKKHWLTVKKGKLVGRYMLQDNLMPAWHGNRQAPHARINKAVMEMMENIQELDKKGKL